MTDISTASVWHYDGQTAHRHDALFVAQEEGFRLRTDGVGSALLSWSDLVALDVAGADLVFGYRGRQGWRIGFAETPDAALLALLPGKPRYGGIIDRIGWKTASLLFAAIAGLVVFIVAQAPGWIAPLVPQAWEDNLGDAIVGDFGGRYCSTPQGDAALRALVGQIDPEGKARSIRVANIPMVNAMALPGRHIILFNGLIDKAESPDEVAGVLGHELGHVRNRDTLTAMMRQMGLSVILGGLDGSAGSQINALLGLSYSREAEHRADVAAVEVLNRATISPLATSKFFGRSEVKLTKKADGKPDPAAKKEEAESWQDATNWFASHPSSGSRRDYFAKAVVKGKAYRPALSAAQWQALRTMCAQDKKVKPAFDWGF